MPDRVQGRGGQCQVLALIPLQAFMAERARTLTAFAFKSGLESVGRASLPNVLFLDTCTKESNNSTFRAWSWTWEEHLVAKVSFAHRSSRSYRGQNTVVRESTAPKVRRFLSVSICYIHDSVAGFCDLDSGFRRPEILAESKITGQ